MHIQTVVLVVGALRNQTVWYTGRSEAVGSVGPEKFIPLPITTVSSAVMFMSLWLLLYLRPGSQ